MLVETTNMAKNYSHCPLKKRPVFILNDDIDEPENLSTKPEDLRITKLAPTSTISPPISPPVSPVSSPVTLPPVSPPAPSYLVKPEPCKPYQHPMAPLSPEHVPVHYAPTTWHRSVAPIYPPAYIPLPCYPEYIGPPSPYYTSSDSSCSPPHSYHVPRQPLAPLAVRPMRYLSTDQSSLSPTSSTTSPPPSTPEDLSETYKKQTKGIRHQCPDCGKSYSTFSGLNKHQQFHCAAGDGPKKSFSCKYCEKVYVSLGALKMHIRTHTLPCKCHLCGKAFSRPWLLQGHIRTHTGEKPFSCQHCHRAFADRSNLRAHLQTHSDVKRYSCTTCSKTFSRMSLLTKHVEGGCGGQQSVVMHQDVKMY